MEIKKVGVVGCGTMGSGIVQVCAQSGYQVIVSEVNDKVLSKGLARIDRFMSAGVERGKITQEEKESTISRIKGTADIEELATCDLVIEAVIENLDLKKKIFSELDNICPESTIIASNTSCLSIIDLAAQTSRPQQVLGLHFFNPVPLVELLEVVRTIATSEETLEVCRKFGESLGKKIIVAPDTPGFIVNRLLLPFMMAAIRMLESGVATREDIDTAIKLGLGHPMGPLELADLTGMDTNLFVAHAIYEELKDPSYTPPVLLKKMVTAGWLGRKTGKGFYEYK